MQKKLPLINSAHDSETRNIINELIKLFNSMGYTYDEALQKSLVILNEAQKTNDMNEDVQRQLNNIILENGDSEAEVVQARGGLPLLKDRLDKTDSQLVENANQFKYKANAESPLNIPTYDGSGQTTHPDVLYFPVKFAGWNYWMCHTPYPFGDDDFENPSIVVSNDGVSWVDVPGLTNPIETPDEGKLAEGYHYSDGALVYANGKLECWFRWNLNGSTEQIYRKTTTNGVDWTDKELVYDMTGERAVLSPSIIYESGKYRMWYVSNSGWVMHAESVTGAIGSWSEPTRVSVWSDPVQGSAWSDEYVGGTPWHLHVTKIDGLYHIVLNSAESGTPNNRFLSHGTSVDGLQFTNMKNIMIPKLGGSTWDNESLYRASLIKVGNLFRLYYSAYSTTTRWGIGMSEGEDMKSLSGSDNINQDGKKLIGDVSTRLIESEDITSKEGVIRDFATDKLKVRGSNAYYDGKELMLFNSGVGAARFVVVEGSTVALVREVGLIREDFEARHLTGSSLKLNESAPAPEEPGVIRYRNDLKKWQGFDGTSWVNFN